MQFASAVVLLIYFTVFIYLLVAGYYFIIARSIFQYKMFCVIYCNLNESQLDLRMISFCTILKFRRLH